MTIEPRPGESRPADGYAASMFFRDLEPFFARKHLTYVDVGAFRGDLFRGLLQTELKVDEAHLIEPNPLSFRLLTESVGKLEGAPPVCYNVALAAAPGRLRLNNADTLSRVVGAAGLPAPKGVTIGGTFEVAATTLDELAHGFRTRKISILKIDVEGYELEVLDGARGLLADRSMDVIYIEAASNPASGQLTYYRAINDRLREQGYQLFRIYQRKPEWFDGSRLVRRSDLAFMSEDFASQHLYQLSQMLARRELERLDAELSAGREDLALYRERLSQPEKQLVEPAEAIATLRTEVEAARAASAANENELVAELKRQMAALDGLRKKISTLESYGRTLEQDHAKLLASRTWRAMEPVRWLSRRLTRRRPPVPFLPRLTAGMPLPAPALQKKSEVQRLEDKLWGGFSETARADLEALKTTPLKGKGTRASAAWVLARWYAAEGEFSRALKNVRLMIKTDPAKRTTPRALLLEADCLMRLGAVEDARARLREGLHDKPDSADLCLAMANSYFGARAEETRLEWINRVFLRAGLQPLVRLNPAENLAIANLAAPGARPAVGENLPKVSVIVPAFEATGTLPFALRGLLGQTWRNLEVLVIDDCSSDNTHAVAESIAATDPRVRVLRQSENLGSYAARNAGLRVATGDLVTTHDADDWSHPQKLETQVRHMLAHPELAATFSDWVRCTADLRVGWLYRAWGGFIYKSMSSIMLRREAFEALGSWDIVRAVGDTDLLRRVEQLWSPAAIATAHDGVPLAFSFHSERSETRQQATHVRTMLYGTRREYNEAGAYWRENVRTRAQLRFPPDVSGHRPFPAPLSILPVPILGHDFDLLFVCDFCFRGGAFVSTFNYIRAARAAGLSVGVFHWRRYDLDVTQALNPKIRGLAQDGVIRIVAPGETVRATMVVVGYPVILVQPTDLFPTVTYENLVVVVNQMAAYMHSGGDPQYDPQVIRDNLRGLFGSEGTWVPISGLVQRLMRADPRYPAPSDTVWVPLIDITTWCADSPRWRGPAAQPVVGRHARDHYTKWPSSAAALRAAYCADRPCVVQLMGGARSALAVIGTAPANWTVHDFGAMESIDFLRRLDFFVHYPHEEYIEEFGRAVLEALAVGVPAVLPPNFRENFGEAAVYAEPAGVWERVAALWADQAGYLAQVRRGRDFVEANSDWSQFPNRLARTISTDLATIAVAP